MTTNGQASFNADELQVFFRGQFVPASEARVSVMTHALHYGTGVFEGIRGNWNEGQGAINIFRMREHYERLLDGCRILMLDIPYSADELCDITVAAGRAQPARFRHIHPPARLQEPGAGRQPEAAGAVVGLHPDHGARSAITWAATGCAAALRPGVASTIPMIPARIKACGIYINSILAKTEATIAGFDEAILLNHDGHVSEGSGENIFMVKNGVIYTPPLEDNVLGGITRDTIMQLAAAEMGKEVQMRTIDRSELYLADEVFLSGTAAHLTPVVELDFRPIADGQPGPITTQLQRMYFDIVVGNNPKYRHWCTQVRQPVAAT